MAVVHSWRLKVERAKKHLNEIEREMRLYSERHPYEAVRDQKTQKNPNVWRFRLRLTDYPDPMIAVIVGDFLFNLRSALDHLAVAIAPRKRKRSAFFPVEMIDPWPTDDETANRPDTLKARQRFESAVNGMPTDAVAVIKELQPYQSPADVLKTHFIYVLSGLEHADKHRNLILLRNGVKNVKLVRTVNAAVDVIDRETELLKTAQNCVSCLGMHGSSSTKDRSASLKLFRPISK